MFEKFTNSGVIQELKNQDNIFSALIIATLMYVYIGKIVYYFCVKIYFLCTATTAVKRK